MIYQKVLKGVAELSQADACITLRETGILCEWWRRSHTIAENEIVLKLTERNIFWHQNHYDDNDPTTGRPFHENTPYISTTAGTIERHGYFNLRRPAFLIALQFATRNFTTTGVVFYAYLNVLGRKALPLQEFSEETRELNIWHAFQQYHPEGEVVAKISIPPPHLEKAVAYDGPAALIDIETVGVATPLWTEYNFERYVTPDTVSNLREPIE